MITLKHSILSKGYRKEKIMSVSLLEVIESGGYDITTLEDAKWLVSKKSEFEGLISEAEALIEESEASDE